MHSSLIGVTTGCLGNALFSRELATHAEQGRLSDDGLFFFAVLLLVAGYELLI